MSNRPKGLTPADFASAAVMLGVSVASVRAVSEVESAGAGFLFNGHPVVLFERHKMYELLKKKHGTAKADQWHHAHPDIVNPSRTPAGKYGRSEEQPRRLERAAEIDRDCALQACSWGRFQIMGFHWSALGYATLQSFVNAMYKDEGAHLFAFCRFIKINPNLLTALRNRNWAAFARGYNGPAYADYAYDKKLASAYNKFVQEATA